MKKKGNLTNGLSTLSVEKFDGKQGKYDVGTKILAISYLEATKRMFDGRMVPEYGRWAEELGIPPNTLRHWYEHQEEILRQAGTLIEELPQIIAAKSGIALLEIFSELERRGLEKVSTRDLNDMLKIMSSTFRLYTGRSTANIAVSSTGIPVVPPKKKRREIPAEDAEIIEEKKKG